MSARVIGPVAADDCSLGRPVFGDAGLQQEFDRLGYVVVDLLDASSVERLRSTYFDARDSAEGVNPPGAYNDAYAEFSVIHSRPDFRRDAFDVINEITAPRAGRHLVDYRPLVANFVNKPPGTGVVPAHQNWAVVDERRYQSVSVWIALSDCGIDDGAMWMAPGSHRRLRGPRGMWGLAAFVGIDEADIESVLTPVPVRAGQAVILDDALVHYSPPNKGTEDRLAVQFVMIPAEADALFSTQVGGDERYLEVEVRVVEPEFFFDFWHGDGDDDYGRVIDHIRVPVVSFTAEDLAALADPAAPPHPQRMGQQSALGWIDTDRAGAGRHGDALGAILRRELDGVTVHDVLDADAVGGVLRALESEPAAMSPVLFGQVIGRPLAEHRAQGEGDSLEDYLRQADRCRRLIRQAFGFDPHERIADVLSALGGGVEVRPPSLDGAGYNPGSVRWYEGGGGGLPAHVENEFEMHADASMQHLRQVVDTRDHLSFFVVLQRPTAGGALTLYDAVDGDRLPRVDPWVEDGRDDAPLDPLVLTTLDPPVGAMVVFGGGWRWHRVDPVTGPRARVTYGAFGARFRDGDGIAVWF